MSPPAATPIAPRRTAPRRTSPRRTAADRAATGPGAAPPRGPGRGGGWASRARVSSHGTIARTRILSCGAAAAVTAGVCLAFGPWQLAPLLGWVVFAVLFLGWTWSDLGHRGTAETPERALRDDPTVGFADAILLTACLGSLATVGLVIFRAKQGTFAPEPIRIALAILAVALAWATVHTVFALRYARMYFTERRDQHDATPLVDFHGETGADGQVHPTFVDFAYLAFTIGMTFQVSDTTLASTRIRGQALRHGLLSYVFGTVIVAITINLVAGLSK